MKLYDLKNKRLLFFEKKADSAYWDALWEEKLKNMRVKKRSYVVKITKRYLEKGSKILEGGCGTGTQVYALANNRYDAYGIDFAKETIKKVKKAFPKLKISYGDVRKTKFKDSYFDGYWSLGVIEHFYEGYDKIISEANRVLRKGGYFFLVFPYMSSLRKLKAKLGFYGKFKGKKKSDFYQFALNKDIVTKELERKHFELVHQKPIDGTKGLKDEVGLLKPILQKIYDGKNLPLRAINKIISKTFAPFSGHAIVLVLRKNEVD